MRLDEHWIASGPLLLLLLLPDIFLPRFFFIHYTPPRRLPAHYCKNLVATRPTFIVRLCRRCFQRCQPRLTVNPAAIASDDVSAFNQPRTQPIACVVARAESVSSSVQTCLRSTRERRRRAKGRPLRCVASQLRHKPCRDDLARWHPAATATLVRTDETSYRQNCI